MKFAIIVLLLLGWVILWGYMPFPEPPNPPQLQRKAPHRAPAPEPENEDQYVNA